MLRAGNAVHGAETGEWQVFEVLRVCGRCCEAWRADLLGPAVGGSGRVGADRVQPASPPSFASRTQAAFPPSSAFPPSFENHTALQENLKASTYIYYFHIINCPLFPLINIIFRCSFVNKVEQWGKHKLWDPPPPILSLNTPLHLWKCFDVGCVPHKALVQRLLIKPFNVLQKNFQGLFKYLIYFSSDTQCRQAKYEFPYIKYHSFYVDGN